MATATTGNAKLTVQQRAQYFAQGTRQNLQMLPEQTATNGAQTLQFSLPKARLLSKLMIDFEVSFKLTHATLTTISTDSFTPYKLIRRLSLDLNNGFSPYVIGGKELAIYNCMRMNPDVIFPQTSNARGYCYMPAFVASSSGTNNSYKFTVEMPVVLNDRDPIGLILLQSNETNVTLSVDIGNAGDIIDNASGYTIALNSCKVRPCLETFSLPASSDAFPDLSVLKLVQSRTEAFNGSGQNVVKLQTGTIYRKLAFYVEDADGAPFEDTDFLSNLELVFNQADVNYSVSAANLAHINNSMYGYTLPKGVFVFDFSYQGIPNLGGTRDYIDTEKLTEFWLRFNSTKGGHVKVISECLARLA